MLSPAFLMLQIARWERRTGVDVNRALYAKPVDVACWAEVAPGCEGVKGTVFLPAGVVPAPGDRLTLDGAACFVKSVRIYPTHGECEVA